MQKGRRSSGITASCLTYYLFNELMPFSTHKCARHSTGNVRLSQVKRMHKLKSRTESAKEGLEPGRLCICMQSFSSLVEIPQRHHHTQREREEERKTERERKIHMQSDFVDSSQMENGRRAEKEKLNTFGASMQCPPRVGIWRSLIEEKLIEI